MIRVFSKLTGRKSFESDFDRFLAVTNKRKKTELRNQARLMNRDLVKLTAPTGNAPINESFNTQRQFGMRAIESDIRKLFKEYHELNIVKSPTSQVYAKRMARLLRAKDYAGLKQMLNNAGYPVREVLDRPDEKLYESFRNSRGRVVNSVAKNPVVVIARGSVAALIKKKQALLGVGKSGWMHGAEKLGLRGIPNWVKRHNGSGFYYEKTSSDGSVDTISIGNRVRHVQEHGKDNRIVERALENRRRAWREQMKAILAKPKF